MTSIPDFTTSLYWRAEDHVDADFIAGGDGEKTVGGLTMTAYNTSSATSFGVVSGVFGVTFPNTLNAAWFGATRNTPYVAIGLDQLFPDPERKVARVAVRFSPRGTLDGHFESCLIGLHDFPHSGIGLDTFVGLGSSSAPLFMYLSSGISGLPPYSGGSAYGIYDVPVSTLGYTPNAVRFTLDRDRVVRVEMATSAVADLASATWTVVGWVQNTARPLAHSRGSPIPRLCFYCDKNNAFVTGQLTGWSVYEIHAETRPTSRDILLY